MGFCRDLRDNRPLTIKIGVSISIIITIIVLIAKSFDGIDAHQYGLLYNGVSVKIDNDNVYDTGLYFVGLGNSFIHFPRNQQYLEFSNTFRNSLDVWSSDGEVLYVEASLYYTLKKDKLHTLYYSYEDNEWSEVVNAIAAETIRDVATTFDTLSFFTNRSLIDDGIQSVLSTRLSNEIYCNLVTFNILAIDIPQNFENAILSKLISAQDVLTSTRLRDSQLIRQAISVVEARGNANITTIQAAANAQGIGITKNTEAYIFEHYAKIRAEQLLLLAHDLGFTTVQELLQYVYTDIIRAGINSDVTGASKLAINIPEGVTG